MIRGISPRYAPPEVFARLNLRHSTNSIEDDKLSDVYSLGVIIYEMLAGYTPFADDDHVRLYEKILANKPRFPAHFDPDAKDLCRKLLTDDLTRRFGNLKNGSKDIRNHKWYLAHLGRAGVAARTRRPGADGPSTAGAFRCGRHTQVRRRRLEKGSEAAAGAAVCAQDL